MTLTNAEIGYLEAQVSSVTGPQAHTRRQRASHRP
jgi:hypothetical protein